jgi:hypothetical protein
LKGDARIERRVPTTGTATFSFRWLLSFLHEAEWTPFQIHYFSGNLVAPVIEPRTSESIAKNFAHWNIEAVDVRHTPV